MPTTIINYKGKDIIYANHKGQTGIAVLNGMKDAVRHVLKNKSGLVLANFENCSVSNEVKDFLKSKESKEASNFYSKQAVIGVRGIKKLLYNVFIASLSILSKSPNTVKIFNNEIEAKEWLIK